MAVPSPITGHALQPADASLGGQRARDNHLARQAQRGRLIRLADQIVAGVEEGEIGQAALEVAAQAMQRASDGLECVPIDSMLDVVRAVEIATALHKMHRLVTGQSTSNALSLSASLDGADLDAKRAALQEQLNKLGDTPSE